MLVISRKVGETIVIADNIKITVMSAGSDKVTIGIEAPKDIKVFREELLDTIEANKSSAEQTSPASYNNLAEFMKQKKSTR